MRERVERWLSALAGRFGSRRSAVIAGASSVLLVAAGLAVVIVGGGGRSLAPGEARLRPDGESKVLVAIGGRGFAAVSEDMVVSVGDRVRVEEGKAILELADGAAAEMRCVVPEPRPGEPADPCRASEVRIGGDAGAVLRLDRGDLLVQVRNDTAVIDGGSADITVGTGAVKLRRSASLVAGVYEGSALLSSGGRSLTVRQYRQAAVVGVGRLPEADGVTPLQVSERDDWDRIFLNPVFDLDNRLVQRGRGFEALLPADTAVSPGFFLSLLPALGDAPLTTQQLEGRSPGENLIGLTLVSLGEGSFEDRYRAVFGFREAGAIWGLVAADQGYDPPTAFDALVAAIDRAPLDDEVVAAPGSGTTPTTRGSSATPTTGGGGGGGGGGSTGGGGGGGGSGGGGGGSSTTTTTTPTTPTLPTPTTTPDCALPLGDLCVVR